MSDEVRLLREYEAFAVKEIATLKAEVERYKEGHCPYEDERDRAVALLRKADELSLKGLPAGIRWMNSVHKLLEEIDG